MHICHAYRCPSPVAPKLLMCRRHWFMVPKALRDRIWKTYRPGQETDKRPSTEYLIAMKAAIRAVAEQEQRIAVENKRGNEDDAGR